MGLSGILAAGLVVGVVAKLVAPNARDTVRLALAMVGGINLLVGLMVFQAWERFGPLDGAWARETVAVLCAALVVMFASSNTSRSSASDPDEGR
jgi:xanthosine utilization system XapX-like protein